MLRVEALEVYYGHVCALQGVSFEARQGEVVSIVGANGAGKSTTLMTISGIVRPKVGRIWFKGKEIQHLLPPQIVERGISQIPEGRQVFPTLTVTENLEMGAVIARARKERKQTMKWVFGLFPRLAERASQYAGTLSGGEQQMLAIGRALMSLPEMLLLDEPSLGLAPILVSNMFAVIEEINRAGTTILLVEQNVYHALRMSHRAYVVENGAITLEGKGEEILQNPLVREAYLGL